MVGVRARRLAERGFRGAVDRDGAGEHDGLDTVGLAERRDVRGPVLVRVVVLVIVVTRHPMDRRQVDDEINGLPDSRVSHGVERRVGRRAERWIERRVDGQAHVTVHVGHAFERGGRRVKVHDGHLHAPVGGEPSGEVGPDESGPTEQNCM